MRKDENDWYLKNRGQRCPFCRVEEQTVISVSSLDIDGDIGAQTVKCTNCKKAWIDIYKLVGMKEE